MTALTALGSSTREGAIRVSVDDRMHSLQSHLRWLASTTPSTRDEVEEIRFLMAEVERDIARLALELCGTSAVNST